MKKVIICFLSFLVIFFFLSVPSHSADMTEEEKLIDEIGSGIKEIDKESERLRYAPMPVERKRNVQAWLNVYWQEKKGMHAILEYLNEEPERMRRRKETLIEMRERLRFFSEKFEELKNKK